jgi:hypothetical protein
MDMTLFREDCAWLREWPDTPIAADEGQIVLEHLPRLQATRFERGP